MIIANKLSFVKSSQNMMKS